jgi:uncharacterized protein
LFCVGRIGASLMRGVSRQPKVVPQTNPNALIVDAIERLVRADYVDKDTMHDLSHIRRVHQSALELAKLVGLSYDPEVVALGAYLHGVVYNDARRSDLSGELLRLGVPERVIQRAMQAALESQTDGDPMSPEGIVLHDGHLLEGGRAFLLVKTLVTGAARGSSLAEIVSYWNQLTLGGIRCVLPVAQARFDEQIAFAQSVFDELASVVEKEGSSRVG